MAKLTLLDIVSGYAVVSTYNTNNTAIETALENTLSRDGTAPNAMGANLDMDSNLIRNLADGTLSADAVNLRQLQATTGTAAAFPSQTGNANKVLKTDGTVVGWEKPQDIANSNTPAGNLAATTIQGAVNELQTDVDTRAVSANTVLDGDAAGGGLSGTYPNPSLNPTNYHQGAVAGGITVTSSPTDICEVSVGDPAVGTLFLITATVAGQKGATPGETHYRISTASGGYTIESGRNDGQLWESQYMTANTFYYKTICGVVRVSANTIGGGMALKLTGESEGSDLAVTSLSYGIRAIKLNP